MKRNAKIIAAAVIVLLLAAIALGWAGMTASAAAANAHLQTATVQRGTLAATVSAAGNVSSPQAAALAFQQTGRIAKVDVQVGDIVKKGQPLMELDTADLQLAFKTAQVNLAASQASLDQTQAQLNFALRTAEANIAASKANLDAAQAKSVQAPNSLVAAKATLDKAQVALQKAQGDYDAVAWRHDVGVTPQSAALQQATIDYNSALANYKLTAATINDSILKQAQAQLDKDSIAMEQAQKNLDTTLRTAQAKVDSDTVAVAQAQRNLDLAQLTAPFDGVVSQVNYSAGATIGASAAVGVVDTSHLQVKVNVAEVDFPKIQVGESADMTLDALPGKTYSAKVIATNPVGTVTQGVVNYPVTVDIENGDGAVRPGMTANLSVVVNHHDAVLLLPNRAVRTQGNQKFVTVVYKNQTIQAPVTTGLANDQSVEITGGLQEGDVVVLSQTQAQTSNARGGFGPGFIFGGGR